MIFTQDFRGFALKGDRVRVRNGYARNYLLPKQVAVLPTPENVSVFGRFATEQDSVKREQKKAEERARTKISQVLLLRISCANSALLRSCASRSNARRPAGASTRQ